MKFTEILNELWGRVKGGVTLAVALATASIVGIAGIAVLGPGAPRIGPILGGWASKWTIGSDFSVFMVIGSLGFVVGSFIGKRCSCAIRKWFGCVMIGGIPIIVCFWFTDYCASRVSLPESLKVTDCTNTMMRVRLKVPMGRHYRLALSVASGLTNTLTARIGVLDGAFEVTNFEICSDRIERECDFLGAKEEYDLEVLFNRAPPVSAAIWLRWLQTYRQRRVEETRNH
jgi:hypothetical protein